MKPPSVARRFIQPVPAAQRALRRELGMRLLVIGFAVVCGSAFAAPPATPSAAEKQPLPTAESAEATGPWKKISPKDDVWIDSTSKQVKVSGEVVLREGQLELFACLKATKEHEAVIACTSKAYVIHAGLLAVGAVAGAPVQFRPDYKAATGTEIEVLVEWTDAQGKVQKTKAQDWIRNTKTGKPLDQPWVFGGSGFWQDEMTGEKFYQAESGDFICVSNFPSAMLDLPIKSSESNEALMFEAWTDRIPPVETKVTLYLIPKIKKPAANHNPAGKGEQRGSKPPALRPTRSTAPPT